MSVAWGDYKQFDAVLDEFLPISGQGTTKGQQMVTAVNKLVYKWYNDGDVYDNTGHLEGWANDLSSYANWLYKYIVRVRSLLDEIFDCYNDSDYEDLLWNLAETVLDMDYVVKMNALPAEGDIYDCEGPFKFEDEDRPFEDEDDDEEDEWYEEEEEDIESSVDINSAESSEDDQLETAMRDLKDDFDFLIQGLEKLQRSGGENYNSGLEIARSFSNSIQEVIGSISEIFSTEEI